MIDLNSLAVTSDGPRNDGIVRDVILASILNITPIDSDNVAIAPVENRYLVEFSGEQLYRSGSPTVLANPQNKPVIVCASAGGARSFGLFHGTMFIIVNDVIYRRLTKTQMEGGPPAYVDGKRKRHSSGYKLKKNGHLAWVVVNDPVLNTPEAREKILNAVAVEWKRQNLAKGGS